LASRKFDAVEAVPLVPVIVELWRRIICRRSRRLRLAPAARASPSIELDFDRASCLGLAGRGDFDGDGDHRRAGKVESNRPYGAVRVKVATQPVDFRKGPEGLTALVHESCGPTRLMPLFPSSTPGAPLKMVF
jgi:hypothetical protein